MSKIARLGYLVSVLLTFTVHEVGACSCAYPEISETQKREQAIKHATNVFVAEVVFVKQAASPSYISRKVIVEDATLKIQEVIKGTYKVGHIVSIRSEIGPGPCGRSVRNDPVWVEASDGKPAKVSSKWLIYAGESQPFELSRCDRSSPMNMGGGFDLKYLRKLRKQNGI